MLNIVWFREDLRIEDNTALHAASLDKLNQIVGLYIIDEDFWRKHGIATCRVIFTLDALQELSSNLAKLNIPLVVLRTQSTQAIPQLIHEFMAKQPSNALYFNKQYEFNENQRDQAVIEHLTKQNIPCHAFHDQLILTPGSIKNKEGEYFKVFTAFKRAWLQRFIESGGIKVANEPKVQAATHIDPSPIVPDLSGFSTNTINQKLWLSGEKQANKRLSEFIQNNLDDYDKQRDFPAIMGTSRLSPYLASGQISARRCFQTALAANQQRLDSGSKGALTWMNELIWREFYKTILVSTPRVSMNKAYQTSTDQIKWDFNQQQFDAWRKGMTGYPLIDAAMRQLNQTGWMHNRLRMITAMFLVKNLFFDWRLGESHFISKLIDGDLAANNGGWQWCASTGTDAAPYFRIFNPITQSKRFDPDGIFIKRYCPELIDCDPRYIHDPFHKNFTPYSYPKPIIELNAKRNRVLTAYKAISKAATSVQKKI